MVRDVIAILVLLCVLMHVCSTDEGRREAPFADQGRRERCRGSTSAGKGLVWKSSDANKA